MQRRGQGRRHQDRVSRWMTRCRAGSLLRPCCWPAPRSARRRSAACWWCRRCRRRAAAGARRPIAASSFGFVLTGLLALALVAARARDAVMACAAPGRCTPRALVGAVARRAARACRAARLRSGSGSRCWRSPPGCYALVSARARAGAARAVRPARSPRWRCSASLVGFGSALSGTGGPVLLLPLLLLGVRDPARWRSPRAGDPVADRARLERRRTAQPGRLDLRLGLRRRAPCCSRAPGSASASPAARGARPAARHGVVLLAVGGRPGCGLALCPGLLPGAQPSSPCRFPTTLDSPRRARRCSARARLGDAARRPARGHRRRRSRPAASPTSVRSTRVAARHPQLARIDLPQRLADAGVHRRPPSPDAVVRQGARVRRALGDLPPHLGAARGPSSTTRRCTCRRQARRARSPARRLHDRRAMPARAPKAGARRGRRCGARRRPALRARPHLQRRRRSKADRRAPRPRHPRAARAPSRRRRQRRSAGASLARDLDARSWRATRCCLRRRALRRSRRGVPDPRQRAPGVGRALAGRSRPAPARAPRRAPARSTPATLLRARHARHAARICCCCATAAPPSPTTRSRARGKATPSRRCCCMTTLGIRFGLGTDGTRSDGFRLMDAAETAQRLAFGLAKRRLVVRRRLDLARPCERRRRRCGSAWRAAPGASPPGSTPTSCSSTSTCRSSCRRGI